MFLSKPFVSARYSGTAGIFVNDWQNLLPLDLTHHDFSLRGFPLA